MTEVQHERAAKGTSIRGRGAREESAVLMDLVSAVMDIAQDDREVTVAVPQRLRSGSARVRGAR